MSEPGRVFSWPCSIRLKCLVFRCPNFLRSAKTALDGEAPKLRTWVKEVNAAMERVQMDPDFANRSLNEGFSGGEKKRHEIVQLELLNPRFAILDETDSGLDIDALRVVAAGVNRFAAQGGPRSLVDHPLHPDSALYQAGLRACFHRRSGGRAGRSRAGGAAGRRGLRPLRTRGCDGRDGVAIMSLDGGPEYPVTTDLSDVAQGGLALAEEPIAFDVEAIRADFPILERTVGGAPLIYLDSANSSQKPRVVVEAVEDHYLNHNANVARAMHMLGAEATEAFEGARAQLAQFIGAHRSEEVVFTKNASEALNLCAYTLGASLRPGDEIVISVMEHHSNIVPWQLLAQRTGAVLRWFDVTDEGRLDLDKAAAEGLLNERTKIVSVAYVSNVLGTINPISQIAALGHAVGATVVVDASQAVPQLTSEHG